jgi:GT2 family glycosyltransferase
MMAEGTLQDASLISVIVLNWNGKKHLRRCLDSLLTQTYRNIEIIVVDNGSTDGSIELLKNDYSGRINLIEKERNYGFTKGVNIGIAASRGVYIALLNNDAVADSQWLEELVKGMSYGPDIGMCACKVLFFHQRNLIDKAGHLMYPDGLNAGRGMEEEDRGQYDQVGEIFFPDGSAALYRRALIEDVGPLDEQFFAYGDDAELGVRARWLGWRCLYLPTAVVYHVHSATLGRYSPLKAFLVERNRFWLAAKLFPLPLLLINPVYTLIRFFWQGYGALFSKGSSGQFAQQNSKRELIWVLIKAYLSGLKGLPQILKKRREIMKKKRISHREFYRLMSRFKISARELALKDR